MKALRFAFFKIREFLGPTVTKFFQPVRVKKQLLSLLFWPAVFILTGWLFVSTGMGELVVQNCRGSRAIAAEMVNESGPEFVFARKQFAVLLEQYVEHMEQRHLFFLLNKLYPEHSAVKQLQPLLAALKTDEDDEEQARKSIFQAGEAIGQFCKDAEDFSDRKVVWFKYERLPKGLVKELGIAIEKSHTLSIEFEQELEKALSDGVLDELEKSQLVERARILCEVNRRTILLLSFARLGLDKPGEIIAFAEDVKRASVQTRRLAGKVEDDLKHASLLAWAKSEDRRLGILEAMSTGNDEKVCELLKEAIETAFNRKQSNFIEQGD